MKFINLNKEKIQIINMKNESNDTTTYSTDIKVEVKKINHFIPAEDYHQNFYARNPSQGYCNFSIPPKLSKLRCKFTELLKTE